MNDITLPRGAPQFEKVSKTDRADKSQNSGAVARGADGDQEARQGCQDGQWLMDRGPDKRQHQG